MSRKGYWVYDIINTPEIPPTASSDSNDWSKPVDYNTVTVYRPVMVEENEDGELFAYYYDGDADPMDVLENGGKQYVPTQQVWRHPPKNAEPAYKYE